jgi:hypothetical protein
VPLQKADHLLFASITCVDALPVSCVLPLSDPFGSGSPLNSIRLTSRLVNFMTSLFGARVTDKTAKRYVRDIEDFLTWCDERAEVPQTGSDLDQCLVQYIEEVFLATPVQGRRQHCVRVRAGIALYLPRVKECLVESGAALEGWIQPSQQRPPCPRLVVFVLASHFIEQRRLDLATLTMLMFCSYMRVSEGSSGHQGPRSVAAINPFAKWNSFAPNKDRKEPVGHL